MSKEWLEWGFKGLLSFAMSIMIILGRQGNDTLQAFGTHLIEIDKRLEAIEISRSLSNERWQKQLEDEEDQKRRLYVLESRISVIEDRTFRRK